MNNIEDFTEGLPKAELHLHIEGTLEPELMFEIAGRNNIRTRYNTVEELKNAYSFSNLQDFLDIYYEGAGVLIKEQDFYDLTWNYLEKAHSQNVIHTEIFFDPQTHTDRGVAFGTVIEGINRALSDGEEKLGISSRLIMCFLRHLDEDAAMETLESSLEYKELITAVGLDSSEKGNPPSKFRNVFERAGKEGFLTVAHAGEEGPCEYVREALDVLHVSRIDHGNHSTDDKSLIDELAAKKIPLTLCPLSNLKLRVVKNLEEHPLKAMLERGIIATVNSDDPAYFGGYINENYVAISKALKLTKEEICLLAKNSFAASFLEEEKKLLNIERVDEYCMNSRKI